MALRMDRGFTSQEAETPGSTSIMAARERAPLSSSLGGIEMKPSVKPDRF